MENMDKKKADEIEEDTFPVQNNQNDRNTTDSHNEIRIENNKRKANMGNNLNEKEPPTCLLYTSPSPRDS